MEEDQVRNVADFLAAKKVQFTYTCPLCKRDVYVYYYSWILEGCYIIKCKQCDKSLRLVNRAVCDACNNRLNCLISSTEPTVWSDYGR